MNSTPNNGDAVDSTAGLSPRPGLESAESSDHSLIRRFRSGDDDAATQLYLKYARRIQGIAAHQTGDDLKTLVEPEDVVQSVFRTFFRRVSRGDYEAPEGEELWRLLLVISLNKIRANGIRYRAAKRDARLTQHASVDELTAQGSDHEIALTELKMVINELVAELPESNQAIVRMRIDGFGVQEISDETQRSKRTVERVLQGFRTELLNRIGDSANVDATE